jgi:hypothetical protein
MTTHHYSLTTVTGADKEARFYANGVRISRERYDEICRRALMSGKLDCFSTKAKQIGTTFRRWNYSQASY